MAAATSWKCDQGDDSPANDSAATRQTWSVGDFRRCTATGGGIIGWRCIVAGHPGTWEALHGGTGGHSLPRVANVAALAAIDTTGYSASELHIAEVVTLLDLFRYVPGEPVTVEPLRTVATNDGTGHWTRMYIPNPYWQLRKIWAFDPLNVSGLADNENAGWATTVAGAKLVPLQDWEEVMNRLKGLFIPAGDTTFVQIHMMSDSPVPLTVRGIAADANAETQGAGGFVAVCGSPTIIRSSTFTAGTAAPSGNTPQILIDSSLPTSWTASDCFSTATKTRWARVGSVHAPIVYDAGTKTAHTPRPITTSESVGIQIGTAVSSFANAQAYDVISIPKAPGAASDCNVPIRYYNIDFQGTNGSFFGPFIMPAFAIMCGFLDTVVSSCICRFYNCARGHGCSFAQVDLSWIEGCVYSNYGGGSGTGEIQIATRLGTSGQQALFAALINFFGNCYTHRGEDVSTWACYDGDAYMLTFDGATDGFDIDNLIGDNPGYARDLWIRIRSTRVNLSAYSGVSPFAGWTGNFYGGDPVFVQGAGAITLATLTADPGYVDLQDSISILPRTPI